MLFKLPKKQDDECITEHLAKTIQNAILLGHVDEIDEVLEQIEDDADFPQELRYGLEALRYFRSHYGAGGLIALNETLQKQKAVVLESSWSAELLEMLKQSEGAAKKRA